MHHINTSCGSEGYYRIRNRGLDTTETYSEHSVHQSACVAQRGTGDITIKRHHMENDFTRKILHHYAFCGSDVYYLGFTSIARARARARAAAPNYFPLNTIKMNCGSDVYRVKSRTAPPPRTNAFLRHNKKRVSVSSPPNLLVTPVAQKSIAQ